MTSVGGEAPEGRSQSGGALRDSTDAFLAALASSEPTPGGGSASALIGAIGAALVGMVGRLSARAAATRSGFAAPTHADTAPSLPEAPDARFPEGFPDAEVLRLIDAADAARRDLGAAMVADEASFLMVMDAYRLPRDQTSNARTARRAAIREACRAAAEPPLTTARIARAVLHLARDAARIGNPQVTSDAAVAAWAAFAALRASAITVRANTAGARDASFTAACEAELGALLDGASVLAEEVERAARRGSA